jgi:hypothetical protein
MRSLHLSPKITRSSYRLKKTDWPYRDKASKHFCLDRGRKCWRSKMCTRSSDKKIPMSLWRGQQQDACIIKDSIKFSLIKSKSI